MEGDGKKLTVSERDEQRVVSGEAGSEEQQSAVSDQEARGAESEEHGMSEAQPKERAAAEVQSEDYGAAESQSSERETSESQLQESARLHCGVEGTESRDSSGSPPCLEMAQRIHKDIQQLLHFLFDKMLQIIMKMWPVGQKSTHSDDQMTSEEGSRESSVGPRSSEVSGSAETESLNKTMLQDMLQLAMFLRMALGISIDSNSSITDTRLHSGVDWAESSCSSGSPPCLEMPQLIIEQIHKNIQQLLHFLFDKMLQIIMKMWSVGQKSTHSDGSAETESLNKTIFLDMFLRTALGISIDSNSSITDTRLHSGVEGAESRGSSGSPPCLEMPQLIVEQITKDIQQLLDLLFDKMLQIIVKKWPVGQKSTHSDDQMTSEEGSRESSVGPRSSEVSGSAETESLNKTMLQDMLQLTMFLRTVLGISIDSNSSITDTSDFSSMLSSLGEIWQDWKSLKANPLDFLTSLATAKKKDSDKKSSDVEKSPGLKDEEQTGAESARQEQEQKQEQDSAESRVGGGTFEDDSVSGGEGDETRN